MATPMNLETVKKMSKDKNCISLAKSLLEAMAYEETVAAIIKPKQKELVDTYKFEMSSELSDKRGGDKIIKRAQDMYLATEEDFQIYWSEMCKFHEEKGFKKQSPDHCPLLVAENLTMQAKRAFIDSLVKYTGIAYDMLFTNFPVNYNNYIELNLKFYTPLVKF